MKTLKQLSVLFLTISLIFACNSNEPAQVLVENDEPAQTNSVAKNTLSSADNSSKLNYFTYTSYSLSNGSLYDITVSEKIPTSFQNLDYGSFIRIFVKEIPTSGTLKLSHRQEPNFDIATGEYFFNNATLADRDWYGPFVGTRPTEQLKIKVENGVTTFTVVGAELSDNYVDPITETKKITVSFSIASNMLTGAQVTSFESLAN